MKLVALSRLSIALLLLTASCWAESVGRQAQPAARPSANAAAPSTSPAARGQVTGAAPEPTRAEALLRSEQDFQRRLIDLTAIVDGLDTRITDMRRDVLPPAPQDMELIEQDLTLAEKELESLAVIGISPLAQLQRSDLQERLFQMRFAMELTRRRWGGGWNVFGIDFFQNALPGQAPDQRPVPRNYCIRAGDKLSVLIVSSLGAQNEYSLTVKNNGTIQVPGAGQVTASGRTAEQLEQLLSARISSRFRQLTVSVTIEELHSIQVRVAGDVARPGAYVLKGMPTVLDALYAAGGPTKAGTFRRITLTRDAEPRRVVDLYAFLLSGDSKQDLLLEDGDLVFVPPVGGTVTVAGEVVRPARYEPDFPITLEKALAMAGGAKPSGYLQTVQVERVEAGEYKVLLSEPLADGGASKFAIKPGDEVTVTTIRPSRTSKVDISGPVAAPGMYGYREGMRIADLVKLAQGLAPDKEVYGGRADILRIDPLKGTQILTCCLDKALSGDETNNLLLHRLDRVFLYEPEQVVFRPRLVTVMGAVARPGAYRRTDGMRVADAIAAAGGILPHAYLQRADLTRRTDGGGTELIRVDLQGALDGKSDCNEKLADRDELRVYAHEEVVWQDRSVRIEGAVQRPGVYQRADGMRVSDLLFTCGGALPEAGKTAELARCDGSGASRVISVSLPITAGTDGDPVLQDRDVVTIQAVNPFRRKPEVVYITGEVAKPGPYALASENEKLADVLARAGGLTKYADTNGLLFLRQKEALENAQQQQDVDILLTKSRMFADKQFLTQLAKLGVRLPEQFIQGTNQAVESLSKPAEVVPEAKLVSPVNPVEGPTAPGELPAPGATVPGAGKTTPRATGSAAGGPGGVAGAQTPLPTAQSTQVSDNVTLTIPTVDSQVSAMGPPVAEAAVKPAAAFQDGQELAAVAQSARISVNLSNALKDPDSADNLTLRDGDRIFVAKNTNVVTVYGAVLHPHSFAAAPGKSVDYYIQRSGGYSQEASRPHVVVVRANGDALPMGMVKHVEPGDIIVVPTTGLIEIAKRWERVGSVSKVIADVLSSVFILTKI